MQQTRFTKVVCPIQLSLGCYYIRPGNQRVHIVLTCTHMIIDKMYLSWKTTLVVNKLSLEIIFLDLSDVSNVSFSIIPILGI